MSIAVTASVDCFRLLRHALTTDSIIGDIIGGMGRRRGGEGRERERKKEGFGFRIPTS